MIPKNLSDELFVQWLEENQFKILLMMSMAEAREVYNKLTKPLSLVDKECEQHFLNHYKDYLA